LSHISFTTACRMSLFSVIYLIYRLLRQKSQAVEEKKMKKRIKLRLPIKEILILRKKSIVPNQKKQADKHACRKKVKGS